MRLRSAFIALPLLFGLTACGADDPAPRTMPTPAATAAPQKAARPAVLLTDKTFMPAMNKAVAGQKSWKTSVRIVAGGEVMTISGVQTAKPLAMSMDLTGKQFGGKARIIVVKGLAYVSIPGATPAGKYLKVNPKNSRDPLAASVGEMLEGGDPANTFKQIDQGFVKVRFVRTETLNGRRLDRYAATVDSDRIMRAVGKPRPAGMPKFFTYTIWMGPDRLVRRMTFTLAGATVDMTMSDYGKPVSIKAPPARSIVKR